MQEGSGKVGGKRITKIVGVKKYVKNIYVKVMKQSCHTNFQSETHTVLRLFDQYLKKIFTEYLSNLTIFSPDL
jgi:hypothetical protein